MIPPLLCDTDPLLAREMPFFDFEAKGAMARARDIERVLIDAMRHHGGIGLAANQIGIALRVFAMETSEGALALFNPMVTWMASETSRMKEGCLSFPELALAIGRPKECQIKYSNTKGETSVLDLKGIECRIALHEIDHLEGVVFTQRVSKLKLAMAKKKIRKNA